ncbi:MAG: DUF5009 domain-containing protein [Pirellulales bacterium]|nr:DUF5009 domain-containing protein [Pirellulales bacterium]
MTSGTAPSTGPTADDQRVLSIDALRGFDMLWIIGGHGVAFALLALVFDPIPESIAYQLYHPDWIGFSAWDMIMPLFLFIVGAAMPFSFAKRRARGQTTPQLYRKIIVRTIVLFVLGMVAQGNLLDWDPATLHIFSNTLQAIAVGYLFAAIMLLHLPVITQVLATAALLVGFWVVLMRVPIPGCEPGILEPQQNLALYIDRTIFGRFEDGTTYTWVLSGMGFVATVMLGVFAGQLLRSKWSPWMKVFWLTLLGAGCLGLGWLWQQWLPIIKHLWTSSMVLWAGGFSYLLLALFYAVIDVIGWRRWAFPFIVIGANAIAVYMATHLVNFRHVSDPVVGGLARHLGAYGEPLQEVAALAVIWLILWYMYRKRTFLRV